MLPKVDLTCGCQDTAASTASIESSMFDVLEVLEASAMDMPCGHACKHCRHVWGLHSRYMPAE